MYLMFCAFRCLCRYCWYTFDVRVTWLQLSVEQEPYKMSRNTPTCTQGGCGHIWNEEEMQRNCDTSVLAKKKKTRRPWYTTGKTCLLDQRSFWFNWGKIQWTWTEDVGWKRRWKWRRPVKKGLPGKIAAFHHSTGSTLSCSGTLMTGCLTRKVVLL